MNITNIKIEEFITNKTFYRDTYHIKMSVVTAAINNNDSLIEVKLYVGQLIDKNLLGKVCEKLILTECPPERRFLLRNDLINSNISAIEWFKENLPHLVKDLEDDNVFEFCPKPEKQNGYFYVEVFCDGEKKPSYEVLPLFQMLQYDESELKDDFVEYKNAITYALTEIYGYSKPSSGSSNIISVVINPNFIEKICYYTDYILDFIKPFEHELSQNEFIRRFPLEININGNQKGYMLYENTKNSLEKGLLKKILALKDSEFSALYYFLWDIVDSFVREQGYFVCKNCNKIGKLGKNKNKKYCGKYSDSNYRSECGRNYQERKRKSLS